MAVVYSTEAVLHVALGIALASRYGALGMAEAALICVVVMEGMVMLPVGYKRFGDSLLRRGLRSLRVLALPTVATAALAWVIGRGDGPLYVFTDTHGRFIGLTAVAAAGIALMIVFYTLLLASSPAAQRQAFVAQFRTSLGRFTARLR